MGATMTSQAGLFGLAANPMAGAVTGDEEDKEGGDAHVKTTKMVVAVCFT